MKRVEERALLSDTAGPQTVKKPLEGVGGAAASPTFIRVSRLCRLRGLLILRAKSIPYKFGRPLVDRICFLAKVVKPLLRHAETGPAVRYSGARFRAVVAIKRRTPWASCPKKRSLCFCGVTSAPFPRPCAGRPAGRRGCPSGTWWPRRSRPPAAAFLRR